MVKKINEKKLAEIFKLFSLKEALENLKLGERNNETKRQNKNL